MHQDNLPAIKTISLHQDSLQPLSVTSPNKTKLYPTISQHSESIYPEPGCTDQLQQHFLGQQRPYKRRIRTKPGTHLPAVPFDQLIVEIGSISMERPCLCPVCHLEFFDKSKFKHHYMVHTGEQPYHCQFCGFRSRQPSNLNRHIREKHPDVVVDRSVSRLVSSATAASSRQ